MRGSVLLLHSVDPETFEKIDDLDLDLDPDLNQEDSSLLRYLNPDDNVLLVSQDQDNPSPPVENGRDDNLTATPHSRRLSGKSMESFHTSRNDSLGNLQQVPKVPNTTHAEDQEDSTSGVEKCVALTTTTTTGHSSPSTSICNASPVKNSLTTGSHYKSDNDEQMRKSHALSHQRRRSSLIDEWLDRDKLRQSACSTTAVIPLSRVRSSKGKLGKSTGSSANCNCDDVATTTNGSTLGDNHEKGLSRFLGLNFSFRQKGEHEKNRLDMYNPSPQLRKVLRRIYVY